MLITSIRPKFLRNSSMTRARLIEVTSAATGADAAAACVVCADTPIVRQQGDRDGVQKTRSLAL
eukprot:1248693-Prymnesium_polylepis.1